jgi:hypothetical protein
MKRCLITSSLRSHSLGAGVVCSVHGTVHKDGYSVMYTADNAAQTMAKGTTVADRQMGGGWSEAEDDEQPGQPSTPRHFSLREARGFESSMFPFLLTSF